MENTKKISRLSRFFLSLAVIVLVGTGGVTLFNGNIAPADAAGENELTGYVWSSNIGWISLNCTDSGSCGASNYAVRVDPATGNLSGHAWSSNIGWISFNRSETGNPPNGDIGAGSGPIAKVDLSTKRVSGWARALSPIAAGANSGGWDGWISFSGSGYGVILDGSDSFAWGSAVVGWANFKSASISTPPPTFSCTGITPANAAIYTGDDAGLTENISKTYSPLNTAVKCEYSCMGGFVWDGSSCVLVPPPQCSDGIDNDGDGQEDSSDPGCDSPSDNDETNSSVPPPPPQCSDGIDNDGDGQEDSSDPGCDSPSDNDETDTGPVCGNNVCERNEGENFGNCPVDCPFSIIEV